MEDVRLPWKVTRGSWIVVKTTPNNLESGVSPLLESDLSPLLVVLGPTGSGKSQLALHLAGELTGEIVNFDSVQVYKGLDIGSAKVSAGARKGIPHHLIDVLEPGEELTAGAYSRLARETLTRIRERGRIPILAGGTGFYLRALVDGLSPAPSRDENLRVRLAELAGRRPAALHRYLRYKDAAAAARIHPNDHQKLSRAIELTLLGDRPASETQSQPREGLRGFAPFKIGLSPDRASLYSALNRRTAEMFEGGLIEETCVLLQSGLSGNSKALQSLGYKQAVQVIRDGRDRAEALNECQTKTRQYAKRQLTWFRGEAGVHWLEGFGYEPGVQEAALLAAREFLVGLRLQ